MDKSSTHLTQGKQCHAILTVQDYTLVFILTLYWDFLKNSFLPSFCLQWGSSALFNGTIFMKSIWLFVEADDIKTE